MADFTPEQISAAISRAADYIENADGNVCLDEGLIPGLFSRPK